MSSEETQAESPQTPRSLGERSGLVITNVGKILGLVVGFHEAFGEARPAVMLYATAIFVGAQAVEDLMLKIIDKTLGR